MPLNSFLSAAIYNSLPRRSQVVLGHDRHPDDLTDLRSLFDKYHIPKCVALHRIYRRFDVGDGEIMVRGLAKDSRIGYVHISKPVSDLNKEKYSGFSYFVDQNGDFQAYEYVNVLHLPFRVEKYQGFLTELASLIVSRGLQRDVGICIQCQVSVKLVDQELPDIWDTPCTIEGSSNGHETAFALPELKTIIITPTTCWMPKISYDHIFEEGNCFPLRPQLQESTAVPNVLEH